MCYNPHPLQQHLVTNAVMCDSTLATCCCTVHKVLMQMLKHTAAHHTKCWCKCCNMLLHTTQSVEASVCTMLCCFKGSNMTCALHHIIKRVVCTNSDQFGPVQTGFMSGLNWTWSSPVLELIWTDMDQSFSVQVWFRVLFDHIWTGCSSSSSKIC